MAKQVIGKVGLTPRGAYVPGRRYERLDTVRVNGSTYVSLVDNNEDTPPSPKWELEAEAGARGTGLHVGEFNANDLTEEGWYDSIVLGRPEGSESDEKYFLYMSSNGGQTCFSRRNSGKAYHRLGLGHPWVALTHDDYAIENALAALCMCCTLKYTYEAAAIASHSDEGYSYDSNTRLAQFYAGDNNEVKSFRLSVSLPGARPNDLIRVRCAYRRGFSAEGAAKDDAEHKYPFDSDAYIFFGSEATKEHDISKLRSNWIKVKSMGAQNFPFTDAEKGWQNTAFMRDRFFNDEASYGWHYIRVTDGRAQGGCLNIYGDFSSPGSWFVFDRVEVYRADITGALTEVREYANACAAGAAANAAADKSKFHVGEFNAGNLAEEGWYDSITSGRPEGSESDEKYILYQSSSGTQICFSKQNGGNAFIRPGKELPWVSINHDDYGLQQSAAAALIHYGTVSDEIAFNEWVANVSAGFGTDSNTRLAEVYAGNGCENKVIDVYKSVFLRPNDIIKVRAIYRRGFSWEGLDNYPYDSDAYIYVSDQTAAGHDLAHLKSDFVKVKSLGSLGFPFTEEQKQWQDLAFMRDILFRSDTEYGWHYIKVNVPVAGNYYLHIAGNFSSNASWIVFGDGQVLTSSGLSLNAATGTISFGGKTFKLTEV